MSPNKLRYSGNPNIITHLNLKDDQSDDSEAEEVILELNKVYCKSLDDQGIESYQNLLSKDLGRDQKLVPNLKTEE